ncbi:MAG: fatty acid metabolism transcriptional regulator FadR [Anaerolineaceae bacterium]
MDWFPPQKPSELTENRLITAILDGHFPPGSNLPPERELAAQLGVTRPTLREALQRMARDGWLDIRHGVSTRVRDYWSEGNLAVLTDIVQRTDHLPSDFVDNLLAVRLSLAPAYTRLAVEHDSARIERLLTANVGIDDTPEAFTTADWDLHHTLTMASGNPIFTLILNGFRDLYQIMGLRYFALPAARDTSRAFYRDLHSCVSGQDAIAAEDVTRMVMARSLEIWKAALQTTSAD